MKINGIFNKLESLLKRGINFFTKKETLVGSVQVETTPKEKEWPKLFAPDGGSRLELSGMSYIDNFIVPENVEYAFLDSLESAGTLEFSKGIKGISLNGLTSAQEIKLPAGLTDIHFNGLTDAKCLNFSEEYYRPLLGDDIYIYLNGLKNAKGLKIPVCARYVGLNGLENAEGLEFRKYELIYNRRIELNGLTSAKGLRFPEICPGWEIMLNGLKRAEGLILPEGATHISLNGLMSIYGLTLPDSVEHVSLNGVTSVYGLVLPKRGGTFELRGVTDLEGLVWPEADCKVYYAGGEVVKSNGQFVKQEEQQMGRKQKN